MEDIEEKNTNHFEDGIDEFLEEKDFSEKLDDVIFLMKTGTVVKDLNSEQELTRLYDCQKLLNEIIKRDYYFYQTSIREKLNEMFKDYAKMFEIILRENLTNEKRRVYIMFNDHNNKLLNIIHNVSPYEYYIEALELINNLVTHFEELTDDECECYCQEN
jgi:hypothetical protein